MRPNRPTFLILTARMGAGHDGVSRELAARLEACGCRACQVDVWDLQPPGVGRMVTAFYRGLIKHAPWAYQLIYRIWLRPAPSERKAPLGPITRHAARRLRDEVERSGAVAVLSTFHLGTQLLGELKSRGQLEVPAISFCVDFAAHGAWVHPDVDANFCLHPVQAERLAEQGARGVVSVGPVVAGRFRPDREGRTAVRRRLGWGSEPVVLVVSGSWGAGRLGHTLSALERSGRHRVVAVVGRNPALRRRLAARHPRARVMGWVENMDDLLRAADVVVENAGGLTAMEALACGRPVVTYLPIPGHGRDNAAGMAAAGISVWAHTPGELVAAVEEMAADSPRRRRLLAAARAMVRLDPVADLLELSTIREELLAVTPR